MVVLTRHCDERDCRREGSHQHKDGCDPDERTRRRPPRMHHSQPISPNLFDLRLHELVKHLVSAQLLTGLPPGVALSLARRRQRRWRKQTYSVLHVLHNGPVPIHVAHSHYLIAWNEPPRIVPTPRVAYEPPSLQFTHRCHSTPLHHSWLRRMHPTSPVS